MHTILGRFASLVNLEPLGDINTNNCRGRTDNGGFAPMYRYHITTKQAWGGFCVQLDERGHLSHQHVNLAGTPLRQGMGLGSFKNV
ncbi:MAG: hypothetical protein ACJAZ1_000726 [Yoonia sp.]|jgi:hypothetical protein